MNPKKTVLSIAKKKRLETVDLCQNVTHLSTPSQIHHAEKLIENAAYTDLIDYVCQSINI